jgi:hypothetical protein
MSTDIIAVPDLEVKLPEDGAHWNSEISEWEITINGDPVAWTGISQDRAWEIYHDMLSLNQRHRRSIIPVFANGQPATMIEWEICQDCGRSVDVGQDCPDCNPPAPFWRIESAAGFTAEVSQKGEINYVNE